MTRHMEPVGLEKMFGSIADQLVRYWTSQKWFCANGRGVFSSKLVQPVDFSRTAWF